MEILWYILKVIAFIALVYLVIKVRVALFGNKKPTDTNELPIVPERNIQFVMSLKTFEIHNIKCRHVIRMKESNKMLLTKAEMLKIAMLASEHHSEDSDIMRLYEIASNTPEVFRSPFMVYFTPEQYKKLSVCISCFKHKPLNADTERILQDQNENSH